MGRRVGEWGWKIDEKVRNVPNTWQLPSLTRYFHRHQLWYSLHLSGQWWVSPWSSPLHPDAWRPRLIGRHTGSASWPQCHRWSTTPSNSCTAHPSPSSLSFPSSLLLSCEKCLLSSCSAATVLETHLYSVFHVVPQYVIYSSLFSEIYSLFILLLLCLYCYVENIFLVHLFPFFVGKCRDLFILKWKFAWAFFHQLQRRSSFQQQSDASDTCLLSDMFSALWLN